jgi:GT2 family glycosyltransferase
MVKILLSWLRETLYVNILGKAPRLKRIVQLIYQRWLFPSLGGFFRQVDTNDYDHYLKQKKLTPSEIKDIENKISGFNHQPLISIIVPVFNVSPKWLKMMLQSVYSQIYQHWELCLVDDGSTNAETLDYFNSLAHPQIKKRLLKQNIGISGTSNVAVEMATGEFIALLDHDDVITIDALYEVVKVINEHHPDLIYSDEDRIDLLGKRKKPFFKPNWSPDLLRSQNYICHFTVVRKKIIEKIGGFRKGYEGAQDHDLFLRISEETEKIYHIPKVLYSWREIDTSTTVNPGSKPYAQLSGLKAVSSHMKRIFNDRAYASESDQLFVYDARCPFVGDPLISIIIPTKDHVDYLENCLDSIISKSLYTNYEIIILDNNSELPETIAYLKHAENENPNVKVIDAPYPFNWSKLNNHGMRVSKGDAYIFLNNDTEVISRDWLERLAEHVFRDDIGTAGPLLLYEDETIQHAGVVVGMGGWADHIFKGNVPQHTISAFVSPMVKRNVLAVTGSCLAISKRTIERIGRFDEEFTVCGSDVEICLRAYENGFNNIYDPFVRLYHFESKTRIPENIPVCDFDMSRKHYQRYLEKGDPFYNLNLALSNTTPMVKNNA